MLNAYAPLLEAFNADMLRGGVAIKCLFDLQIRSKQKIGGHPCGFAVGAAVLDT